MKTHARVIGRSVYVNWAGKNAVRLDLNNPKGSAKNAGRHLYVTPDDDLAQLQPGDVVKIRKA